MIAGMREAVDYYRRRIFHGLWAVGAALAVLLWPVGLLRAEIIRSFTSEVRLQKDTTLDVSETIVMDFESAQRHGIYRDMPVRYERYGNPYSVFVNVDAVTD